MSFKMALNLILLFYVRLFLWYFENIVERFISFNYGMYKAFVKQSYKLSIFLVQKK